jgi:sec-independent protein translocase protein TatA
MVLPLAFLDVLGLQWFLILAILGILLYGERLPEVAAKFGKQLMQLKKAAQSVRDEIESVANDAKYSVARGMEKAGERDREEPTAPKFEPPPDETADAPAAVAASAEPRQPMEQQSGV